MNVDGASSEVKLAMAVLHRAILDLSTTKELGAKLIRQDAYDFLVNRLWEGENEEDYDNLWRAILGLSCSRDLVLDLVHERCELLPNGHVKVLPRRQ